MSYQERIAAWVVRCFGTSSLLNRHERASRVLEEAVELAQAEGLTLRDVRRIATRTYARPAGEPAQEAAGVALALLGWAEAAECALDAVIEHELARIEALPVEHFRERQRAKAEAGTSMKLDL